MDGLVILLVSKIKVSYVVAFATLSLNIFR